MAPVIFPGPKTPLSPHRELADAWLADYELKHNHRWKRGESRGDPAVRQFFEAVRDQLRILGALANVGPTNGAIYVIDAVREQTGFVVWSVDVSTGTWSGHLNDAREINLRGTGVVPGAAQAFASIGPPPSGFFNTVALGGMYRKQQDVVASVYGRGGTGIEILDYPDKMFDTFKPDFSWIDPYDPRGVANAMMVAMRAKKLTFSGTSNINDVEMAGQEHAQTPVVVTPELIEHWRELGRDGGSWKCEPIRGTPFNMPAPA
jgi:hypothetical protein